MDGLVHVEGGHLFFDGCDTVELAREYGTPLYLMSETAIRERIAELKASFLDAHPNTAVAYASKAFQTLDMLRLIRDEGLSLDVVSGGELHAARRVDFPMERIFFHGNAKTPEELRQAVEFGVGRVVVDNRSELDLLDEIARKAGKRMPILFRITPGVDSHTHEYISTGRLDSKFGIPLDRRVRDDYIGAALRKKGVELKGFHFHIGSQLLENESHLKAVGILLDFLREIREEYGFAAEDLNLGGGFGVRYTAADRPRPLSAFTDPMLSRIETRCAELGMARPRIIIEPGRWIVGEAGMTLYTVCSVKAVPDLKTYIGVDGGMPDNPRPSLYGAKYEALAAGKAEAPVAGPVTVAGKCCESGDILIRDIPLPALEPGDLLAVFTTGAYNYTMASNYNRSPRPALVLVSRGTHRLSVRRETYDELLAREL